MDKALHRQEDKRSFRHHRPEIAKKKSKDAGRRAPFSWYMGFLGSSVFFFWRRPRCFLPLRPQFKLSSPEYCSDGCGAEFSTRRTTKQEVTARPRRPHSPEKHTRVLVGLRRLLALVKSRVYSVIFVAPVLRRAAYAGSTEVGCQRGRRGGSTLFRQATALHSSEVLRIRPVTPKLRSSSV